MEKLECKEKMSRMATLKYHENIIGNILTAYLQASKYNVLCMPKIYFYKLGTILLVHLNSSNPIISI